MIAINQPRSVGQHVTHRHWTAQRRQLRHIGVTADQHLGLGEGRNVFGDRVIETKTPSFPEHHRGDIGHRLGHGIDAEDRVCRQWLAARQVQHTGTSAVDL